MAEIVVSGYAVSRPKPKLFQHAFGKHPEEELYAVEGDSGCLDNLAGNPKFSAIQKRLAAKLERALKKQGDPRVLGCGDIFESYPRIGGFKDKLPGFKERGKYNPAYQTPATRSADEGNSRSLPAADY